MAALTGRAGGYVLNIDPDEADLHRFRRLRRLGATAASSSRAGEAVGLLRDADRLWHGPAMAGIRGEWFAAIRVSLQEERRAAVIERVQLELELDLGRHGSLVGELTSLLAQYPMDETLIACHMTALYRCGRMSEALSLFRETRNRLVEDQSTEPGAVLAELHQRILRQDPRLSASPAHIRLPGDPPAYGHSAAGQKSALIRSSSERPRASLGAARQPPDRCALLGPADPPFASAAGAISRARRTQDRRNRTVKQVGASS